MSPGTVGSVVLTWKTQDALPGLYQLEIVGHAGSLELAKKVIPVELSVAGSLVRAGELETLEVVGPTGVGQILQLRGPFKNTGDTAVLATFEASIYNGDKLIERKTSLETLAAIGASVPLEAVFDSAPKGRLRIVGKVNFDGIVSNTKEVRLNLGEDRSTSFPIVPVVGGVGLVTAVALSRNLVRRRRSPAHRTRRT